MWCAVSEKKDAADAKKEATAEAKPAAKPAAKPKKPPVKPLPEMMQEEIIPPLKAALEAEDDVSQVELSFEDNRVSVPTSAGDDNREVITLHISIPNCFISTVVWSLLILWLLISTETCKLATWYKLQSYRWYKAIQHSIANCSMNVKQVKFNYME